jgi:hypothetical protein
MMCGKAFFTWLEVLRVECLSDPMGATELLSQQTNTHGRLLAISTNAGGTGKLAAVMTTGGGPVMAVFSPYNSQAIESASNAAQIHLSRRFVVVNDKDPAFAIAEFHCIDNAFEGLGIGLQGPNAHSIAEAIGFRCDPVSVQHILAVAVNGDDITGQGCVQRRFLARSKGVVDCVEVAAIALLNAGSCRVCGDRRHRCYSIANQSKAAADHQQNDQPEDRQTTDNIAH